MGEARLSDGTTIGHWVAKSDADRRAKAEAAARDEFAALHRAVEQRIGRRVSPKVLADAINASQQKEQAVDEVPEPERRAADERVREERESYVPAGVAELVEDSGQAPHMKRAALAYVAEQQSKRDVARRAESVRSELSPLLAKAIRDGDTARISDLQAEFERRTR